MPRRETNFANNKFYHVYNRGTDKRKVFLNDKDFIRFLWSLNIFNDILPAKSIYEKYHLKLQRGVRHPLGCRTPQGRKPLVTIICYCLPVNHYHLLLRQETDKGISEFMKRISGGYTNYFNIKYKRSGSLFQGKFKFVEIKSDAQLWQASCHINGNAEIHGICKAQNWLWSSCMDYLGLRKGRLCAKELVLKDFKSIDEYKELLRQAIQGAKTIKEELKAIALESF